MISKEHVRELAQEGLRETDCYLVDVLVSSRNKISVFIDRDGYVAIDQCVKLSRFLESQLDREAEDFELEVSSPGLDQPFKVRRQYDKNAGKEVDVVLADGRKLTGVLLGANDEGVSIKQQVREKVEGKKGKQTVVKEVSFSWPEVKETKLVIKF